MQSRLWKKVLIVGIIFILSSSIGSNISGYTGETNKIHHNSENAYITQEKVVVSCDIYGINGESRKKIELLKSDAEYLLDKINELAVKIAIDSSSSQAEHLQNEIISIGKDHNLIPEDILMEDIQPKFTSSLIPKNGVPSGK